jgi:hypothetical protein
MNCKSTTSFKRPGEKGAGGFCQFLNIASQNTEKFLLSTDKEKAG